ncbi:MAG: hypothetical protein KA751_13790 [Comamonas sp.]|nr:hypothetical protein [Comamonas sp.]
MSGDGNGDGILDSVQQQVVSTEFVQSSNPSGNANAAKTFITLVADSSAGKVADTNSSVQLTQISQKDAPANLPAGINMPLGLIAFTANIAQSGAAETFSLYVTDNALGINGYWKQSATGVWTNLASAAHGGAIVQEGGKLRLDFSIADGGEFDADGQANGVIVDPGAIGSMPLSLVGYAPDLPTGGFWF